MLRGEAAVETVLLGDADAAPRLVVLSAYPLWDGSGNIVWRAELGDAHDAGGMAAAVETAGLGLLAVDRHGDVSYANGVLAGWLGYPLAALVGSVAAAALMVYPLPERGAGICRFLTGSGETIRLFVVRLGEGTGGSYAIFPEDAAPTDTAAGTGGWLRRLFDEAPLGMAALDASGRITDANRVFRAAMGATEGEVAGLAPKTGCDQRIARP
ncbi:MAG: PAS domain-containing protein [Alphaproteobacteria bacterium]|nr:PAS domain-containing protein [Alphaproteobacteria bacterium]